MSCDFNGTTKRKMGEREGEERNAHEVMHDLFINNLSIISPMLCRIYACSRQMIKSRSFHQGHKEGSSFSVPSWHDATNSVGGYSFVYMCNNFRMHRILSPVYSRSLMTASWDTCTFASARLLLFRWSICIPIYIICFFCCWNEECGKATRICKYRKSDSES